MSLAFRAGFGALWRLIFTVLVLTGLFVGSLLYLAFAPAGWTALQRLVVVLSMYAIGIALIWVAWLTWIGRRYLRYLKLLRLFI